MLSLYLKGVKKDYFFGSLFQLLVMPLNLLESKPKFNRLVVLIFKFSQLFKTDKKYIFMSLALLFYSIH